VEVGTREAVHGSKKGTLYSSSLEIQIYRTILLLLIYLPTLSYFRLRLVLRTKRWKRRLRLHSAKEERMSRNLAVHLVVSTPDRISHLGNGSLYALRYIWELFFTVCRSSSRTDLPTNFPKGLDTTVAADVQAKVYEDLGHIENLQWVGVGFPMASAATILTYTRGYGLFNVKALVMSSFFVFEIGSAICGAAPTSNALIVGRVIAGIGGGGMYLG
jgi:hypothetical protein